MRILLVEDDRTLCRTIELMLTTRGFSIEIARTGEEAIEFAEIYDFDLMLLDLGLPDMSGLDVVRALRRGKIVTPVIILTGADGVETKVKVLTAGADDFIVKPVHFDELAARMQAVIRRARGYAHSVIQIGDLTVDLDGKRVKYQDTTVALTVREYETIELLALRRGKTLSKSLMMSLLYGGLDEPEPKIIDVFVCKIRKKLALVGAPFSLIETIWGGGYRIGEADYQPLADAA